MSEFTRNWFEDKHRQLFDIWLWPWLCRRMKSEPVVTVLEIGAFEGAMTRWLQGHLRPDDVIIVVDPWDGSEAGLDTVATEEHYRRFLQNTGEPLSLSSFRRPSLIVMREPSFAALPKIPDRSADLVIVDGLHTAEAVAYDTAGAFRLTRKHGLILWDDFHSTMREEQVQRGFYAGANGRYPALLPPHTTMAYCEGD